MITQGKRQPAASQKPATFAVMNKSMVGLLLMVILCDMGERMAERFLPIYLIALGGGAISIGLLNGLDNLLSALYSYPGGVLSDRLGTKKALIVFNCIAIFGFTIVAIVPRWEAVLFGAIFFISWSAISLPATMGLIYRIFPKDRRTMGVTMHSLVRRVPMALGPVLGGVFIAMWGERTGIRLAFCCAIAMALAAMVMQQALIEPDPQRKKTARGSSIGASALWRMMGHDLRSLLVADILVRFCEQIPYAFVVVWCMKTIPHPVSAPAFGILTTIEMATAVVIYIPVAYFADRAKKKPFVVATFVFFTLFPLALLYSRSFPWLAAAFVLRGLKEFGEPTRKALIMDLVPEEHKAGAFGLYYLLRDMIVSVAAFGGALLWEISPTVNLLTALAFGAAGTLWFALRGHDLNTAGAGR
ncbi:MAG: MFS transporter [bacterium]